MKKKNQIGCFQNSFRNEIAAAYRSIMVVYGGLDIVGGGGPVYDLVVGPVGPGYLKFAWAT